ncbi:unnamed protein product, partial [Scytosiphon promiscuus]
SGTADPSNGGRGGGSTWPGGGEWGLNRDGGDGCEDDLGLVPSAADEGRNAAADAADGDRLPVLFDLEGDDDGGGGGADDGPGGDSDNLDDFPGERKLYVTGGRAYQNAVSAAVEKDFGSVDEMGEEGELLAAGVVGAGRGGEHGGMGEEAFAGEDSSGDSLSRSSGDAAGADTPTGNDEDEDEDEDEDDLFGDQGDASLEQSWDDLVEGVTDEGVLHGHGRAGLPDPLEEDSSDTLQGEAAAVAAAAAATAADDDDHHDHRGLGDGVAEGDGGGGNIGAEGGARDDGLHGSREEREEAYLSQARAAAEGDIPSALSPPLRDATSAQTVVGLMAETVGARRGASHDLLEHFVSAGGGDVSKAAALYLSMAEEFLELRDMARKRRNLSMADPPLRDPATAEETAAAATNNPKLAGGAVSPGAAQVEVVAAAAAGEGKGCVGDGAGGLGEARSAGDPVLGGSSGEMDSGSDGTGDAAAAAAAATTTGSAADGASDTAGGGEVAGDGSRPCPGGVARGAEEHPRLLPQPLDEDFPSFEADPADLASGRDEYSVTISSQKLGMTVENVLERTVVRAAAPGGGAEAAGVETGSLLVALDGQSTKYSSHFEVIELLRVANRPLTLRLRRVGRERLLRRRSEMRALTRPHGVFGDALSG